MSGPSFETELSQALERVRSQLPPELRDSSAFEEVEAALPKATSFSVLVCGKTGTGKSTLVNGIIGEPVAKVEKRLIRHGDTRDVKGYRLEIGGVSVTVWDTPGLQDGSANNDQKRYISDMKGICRNVDLALYCIKMPEKRFPVGKSDNPDVKAMANLTKAFKPDFWRKTIVVLTYANTVEAFHVEWKIGKLDASAKAVEFQRELEDWRGVIQDALISDIKIPEEIAKSVVVVPAGHSCEHRLPDRDFWLSALWFKCLEAIGTPAGAAALVRINYPRIKYNNELKDGDFEGPLEKQPIVVEGFIATAKDNKYKILLATTGGAGVGGVGAGTATAVYVGTGAAAGGVVAAMKTGVVWGAAAIGATVGATAGLAVGLMAVAAVFWWKKEKRE